VCLIVMTFLVYLTVLNCVYILGYSVFEGANVCV